MDGLIDEWFQPCLIVNKSLLRIAADKTTSASFFNKIRQTIFPSPTLSVCVCVFKDGTYVFLYTCSADASLLPRTAWHRMWEYRAYISIMTSLIIKTKTLHSRALGARNGNFAEKLQRTLHAREPTYCPTTLLFQILKHMNQQERKKGKK